MSDDSEPGVLNSVSEPSWPLLRSSASGINSSLRVSVILYVGFDVWLMPIDNKAQY